MDSDMHVLEVTKSNITSKFSFLQIQITTRLFGILHTTDKVSCRAAEEVRKYHLPDFSNWKNHDAFERAFARLEKDLRTSIKSRRRREESLTFL
jgi:hypothetical protein